MQFKALHSELELECSSRNSSRNKFFCNFRSSILTSIFHNFRKVWNRPNSEYSVNSKCSETPVFDPKTLVFAWAYFWTIFTKFLRVQKTLIFLKNFQTLVTELFRNSWKQKVQKILSFAGPYCSSKFFNLYPSSFHTEALTF